MRPKDEMPTSKRKSARQNAERGADAAIAALRGHGIDSLHRLLGVSPRTVGVEFRWKVGFE
jgi:hypothetical protein